jgi:WD40 repeat protein
MQVALGVQRPTARRVALGGFQSSIILPPLDAYIILTSAKRTATAQRTLTSINVEQRSLGLFKVELMTWERIELLLQEYAHVARRFYKTLAGDSVGRLEQDLASIRQSVSELSRTIDTHSSATAGSLEALIEYASVGDQLESSCLCGEFQVSSRDIVVWEESVDGPRSPIALFHENGGSYVRATSALNRLLPFATRIRAAHDGGFIAVQEREGVSYVAPSLSVVTEGVRFPIAEDPIIRHEAVHPSEPIVVLGTDYGMLVAWDWERKSVLFCKRYFPRREIVWMTSISIDSRNNFIQFVFNNVLHEVRIKDGELMRKRPLGTPEETGKIAFHSPDGLLAVGGVMETRLYAVEEQPTLLWKIQNPLPLVHQISFSPDGRLLSVTAGMGIGGTALMVVDVRAGRVVARHGQVWPPKTMSIAQMFGLGIRWVNFSNTSDLFAIGEGGRVRIYRCPALK